MATDGSIDHLVDAVASHRGSPIDVSAAPMGRSPLSGFRVAGHDGDHIVYSSTASAIQRDLIICHELAHLLLGHASEFGPHPGGTNRTRLVTRHTYSVGAEAEAQRVARAIVRLSRSKQRASRRSPRRPAHQLSHPTAS